MCDVVNFKQYGSVRALDQAFGPRWLYIGRPTRVPAWLSRRWPIRSRSRISAATGSHPTPLPALAVAANPGW
jgi:hypothetical protein